MLSSLSLNIVLTLRDKKRNGETERDEFESILDTSPPALGDFVETL